MRLERPVADVGLEAFAAKVLAEAEPLSQNTGPDNLGFGWIYYALVRNLSPEYVVAIGSCRGFMPFCAARAVQDNGRGHVLFVDPSYAGGGDPGWSGVGAWSDPAEVAERIADFGLTGWITHLRMTSAEAFPHVVELVGGADVGVVIVDGAHTAENSLEDFELYSSLASDGLVLFHDATNPDCGVTETIRRLAGRGHGMVTIHRDVGLTIVEVGGRPVEGDPWPYLSAPSNRAALLVPHVRELLRPGDRVLDLHCGYAPLAPFLDGVHIFGCDRDPHAIATLRTDLPEHRWEQLDETELPFAASLPDEVDVLVGLGVSHGGAPWDPRHALDCVRYLLGRYLPRACLFETAADYQDGAILSDLATALGRLGYELEERSIDTDLTSFPRRRLLVARRPEANACS